MTVDLVRRVCVLCGATPHSTVVDGGRDREYGAPGEWAYLRCGNCGLVRLDPMPDAAQVAALYPPEYHGYQAATSLFTRRLFGILSAQRARVYLRLVGRDGRVLDVGSADGAHFPVWRRVGGWSITGIEFNADAAARGRAAGHDIRTADAATETIEPSAFDLVVMNHLLEHVHDPLEVARRACAALRPGGALVGEVPSLRSWDFVLFRRHWGGSHWPRHLHQFDPDTLTALLQRAGFAEIRVTSSLHTGHWALSLQNLLQSVAWTRTRLVHGRSWYYGALLVAFLPVNVIAALLRRTGIVAFSARAPA